MNVVEKQLLAVFISDWEQVNHLADSVDVELFSGYQTRKLWQTIYDLRNKPISISLVEEHFPDLYETLGDEYGVPFQAESYIQTLKEEKKRRDMLCECENAAQRAKEGEDVSEVISDVTSRLVALVDVESEVTTDSMVRSYQEASEGNSRNIPLPFKSLTQKTGGIRRGMVTVLTGRSKAGKSMFKSFWHKHLGLANIPTLDCCFEDGIEIAKGRCASIGKYSVSDLMNGGRFVNESGHWRWIPTSIKQIELSEQCLREIDSLPMYWHQKRARPKDMISIVSKFVKRNGVQCVFIDGAKDMLRPTGKYNDCGFEEEASQALVDMAQRLNVAVIVIHHLTKIPKDSLITVGNIRGSGNIVSDCRSVYALQGGGDGQSLNEYADAMHYPISENDEGICTTRVFECLENNHGQSGKVWLDTDLGKCDFWKM